MLKLKPNRSWLYYLVALLGLPLYFFAFEGHYDLVRFRGPDPLSYCDFPGTLVGADQVEREMDSPDELRSEATGFSRGERVVFITAGGERREINSTRRSLEYVILTSLNGLLFLLACLLFFAGRTGEKPVRDFFWASFLFGLAVMIGESEFTPAIGQTTLYWRLVYLAVLAILPLIFLRLCLNFPRPHPALSRLPYLMPSLWVIACGIIFWRCYVYARYCLNPTFARFQAINPARIFAGVLLLITVAGGIWILFKASRRLRLARERSQVKWLLLGITVGVTPYVFIRTTAEIFGVTVPWSPQYDRLFELAIPISYVLAVVRFQFLDIDIVIRRGLIYLTLAGLLYSIFALLVYLVFDNHINQWEHVYLACAGLVAGIMFLHVRHWIGRWVDRLFFKIIHDHSQWLAWYITRLESVSGDEEICLALETIVAKTLDPPKFSVIIHGDQGLIFGGTIDSEDLKRAFPGGKVASFQPSAPLAAPGTTSLSEIEQDSYPAYLMDLGLVMAFPLRVTGAFYGVICIGARRTERHYVENEMEVLHQATAATAKTLERIRLVQLATKEKEARSRSEEVNRLKSEFFSHIAHDLRTPLASIQWSADNLLDGVVGDVPAAIKDYLSSIKAASSHLDHLVNNLLDLSRLERGTESLLLETLHLGPLLANAIAAMRPLAEEKKVTIQMLIADQVPAISGNGDKLLEVVVNLLDNAIKYSPPNGEIMVMANPHADGGAEVSVVDQGPGISAADLEVIFSRFQQGEPSPHSQKHGFGLGLFIVQEYLIQMGGEVQAANHPDGGAVFSCKLFPVTGKTEG